MASGNSLQRQQGGKLIALEGDADIISTQLRLLPPSQKILILPSLIDSITRDVDKHSFNPRAFIREVHTTFTHRMVSARSFLQSSSSTHPRLVFMNGGSVSVRTACITRICENVTNGDIGDAETIFNEIAKDGVAGLMRHDEVVIEQADTETEVEDETSRTEIAPNLEGSEEDPTVKAMKAAESLDRETAALQDEIEGEEMEAVQSMADTEDRKEGPDEDHAKVIRKTNDLFTSPFGNKIVRTVVTVPSKREDPTQRRSTLAPISPTSIIPVTAANNFTTALSHQSEDEEDHENEDGYDGDKLSPGHEPMISVPNTPGVVYGEACIVDVQALSPKSKERQLRKVKSVDVFYPSLPRRQSLTPRALSHSKSEHQLRHRATMSDITEPPSPIPGFLKLPRTTYVRASQTTIKKSPTLGDAGRSRSSSTVAEVRVFVDRGTDASEFASSISKPGPIETEAMESKAIEAESFEPPFAMVEDMVIHFANGTPNEIFESVIRSYKNGSYPAVLSSQATNTDYPPSPTSLARPTSHYTAETDDEGFHGCNEFDPYSSDNTYPPNTKQWPPRDKLYRNDSKVQALEPPTPTMTPPPPSNSIAEKFCTFSPADSNGVISVQNSLRSLLGLHFPAGENGYTQQYFPITPEADRLWKPVFRTDEDEGKSVDQIIALGCEEGVNKEFFAQISGQVERLGTKRDGLNRSGKLDLRYLIGIAMQTFSMSPLVDQSTCNPLSDPTLLATLIIPHLEAYLATNISIRLLILIYPSTHLSTVMALRKILGQDALKIAGILDSLSYDPPSFGSHSRTPTSKYSLSNKPTPPKIQTSSQLRRDSLKSLASQGSHPSLQQSKGKSEFSFSKANYLLPSIATDSEISNFLSGIWTSLVEKSTYYNPEPEPEPRVVEKIVERFIEKPSLPPTPASMHPPVSLRQGRKGSESKIAQITGNASAGAARKGSLVSHNYAQSIASTVKTTASERGRREDKAWENFYVGEEDSDDDAYDRMIMGRAGARIVPEIIKLNSGKKRSSKKALKWLGLA